MTFKVSDDVFVASWNRQQGYAPGIAKELGLSVRGVMNRRSAVEERLGIILKAGKYRPDSTRHKEHVERIGHRITIDIQDGIVPIFGDAHYWPGDKSAAHQALVRFIKKYKPGHVICNGDALDNATISRHPPLGWGKLPDVADELAYCKEMLGEIEAAAPAGAKLIFNLGNHDMRFTARLATTAPQYAGVFGTDLPDHFPAWNFGMSTMINNNTMVKHRWHGGVHATWNNALKAGLNIFTNHLHQLRITPLTDYNGRRYGVDCGTLSDFGPETEKYAYAEGNALNWGSGFAVATFKDGVLLPPEIAVVQDGITYFRGVPL